MPVVVRERIALSEPYSCYITNQFQVYYVLCMLRCFLFRLFFSFFFFFLSSFL